MFIMSLVYVFGSLMDGSKKVMKSLDSLWFFNNVLTLPAATFQHKDHATAIEEGSVEEEKPSKHKIQEAPGAEILVPRCPKCGKIAVGMQQQIVQVVEFAKPPTVKPRESKKKVVGELDLEFHGNSASDHQSWLKYGEYPNFESQGFAKMPPLNDSFAMKQHLKSWAYAVAWTVR